MIVRLIREIHISCLLLLLNQHLVQLISSTPTNSREDGSATLGPGEILLQVFGRPFAPTSPPSVSPLCRTHSDLYLQALANFTPWALHMYDSSTKIPSGIITGNIQQLGNYEQCVNLFATSSHLEGSSVIGQEHKDYIFKGQQCTATVQFSISGVPLNRKSKHYQEKNLDSNSLDMKDLLLAVAEAAGMRNWTGPTTALYKWAFCVPSTCTGADVEAALREKLLPLNNPGRVEVMVDVNGDQCLTSDKDNRPLTIPDLAIICVFVTFALLLASSTMYDLLVYRKSTSKYEQNKRRYAVLLSFSLYTNGKNLMDTKGSKDTMKCMNGIRFLTVCWVIFGHTYYMNTVTPKMNSSDVQYLRFDWSMMVVMNGTLSTDTFFFLSGVLLCYVFLRQMTKGSHFNIAKFYLHRYLRLTPPLAIVVFFYATLFYRLGSGPLWNTWVGTNRDYCVDNWWSNLLYVNNYIDLSRMCMDHTWYLAVDMQLFWFSPLIVYPMWRWSRMGIAVWGVAFSTSVIVPFVITYTKRLAGAMLYTTDMTMVGNVYVYIYTQTYNRGGPYLIGIALGYLLHATREKPWRMSKVCVAFGWLCSVLLCVVALFGVFPMYQLGHKYNPWEASSFAALYRSVWALGVSWIVFACVQGHGGIVNAMLSWKLFLPLSRVSYSSYLCHFMVLLYNAGSTRTPGFLSNYNIVCQFLGNTCITLFLATIINLTFEVPFMNLDRALLSRDRVTVSPTKDCEQRDEVYEANVEMNAKVKDINNIAHISSNMISITCSGFSDKYDDRTKPPECNGYDNVGFESVLS